MNGRAVNKQLVKISPKEIMEVEIPESPVMKADKFIPTQTVNEENISPFEQETLAQGIIWSMILGPPKAKQLKGRR